MTQIPPVSPIIAALEAQIAQYPLLVYIKGTPSFPQCGFSGTVTACLEHLHAQYHYVNVLAAPVVRATLPKVAQWPTFPQIYLKGELLGGCDILKNLYESGELARLCTEAGVCGPKATALAADMPEVLRAYPAD